MLLTDARATGPHRTARRARPAREQEPNALGPGEDPRGGRAHHRDPPTRRDRRVPGTGGDRRRPRPGPRRADTDWSEILALYRVLERMHDNPMVTLNRAVATAMVDGPDAGLAVVDDAADQLGDHHRLLSVRGHLLELAGRRDVAVVEPRAPPPARPALASATT